MGWGPGGSCPPCNKLPTTLHKHGGRRNNFKFKLSQVYYRCHLKSQKLPPADWSVGVWGERGAHGFVAPAVPPLPQAALLGAEK